MKVFSSTKNVPAGFVIHRAQLRTVLATLSRVTNIQPSETVNGWDFEWDGVAMKGFCSCWVAIKGGDIASQVAKKIEE